MNARKIKVKVLYNAKDISEDLAQHLKSINYNDVMSGYADDVSLTLEDMAELWEGDWLPEKGATISISIISEDWTAEGERQLDLGAFEIDEIEITGPPHEVKIKAVSVPDNNTLRGVERNRSWEKTKLSVILRDIAAGAGMEPYYSVADDPELDRAEQTEESDLAFMLRICKDEGLALKIADGKIIIFDEAEYEQKEPAVTILREGENVKGYQIRTKTRDIYKACRVKYANTKKGIKIEYTYTPDENKQGKVLQVNEQVESIAAAEKLAKKKLREKNCEETTVALTLMGTFELLAGNTVTLKGFHAFDGKYIITKGSHSIGGGYGLNIDLRRCLDGY
jgi:phage protein D